MSAPLRYRIPATVHRVEEEIQRSRFITTVNYTPTVESARAFIAAINAEFPDASHCCWAYVVGAPGSTSQIGMSDAGEPHGTAGRPMLNVLLHSDVGDICAVTTRYFGGTLLGKGGLARAYSGGVQLALQSLPTVERIPKKSLLVVIDYAALTPLRRILSDFEAEISGEEFDAGVTLHITLPTIRANDFSQTLIDLTKGQALIEEE